MGLSSGWRAKNLKAAWCILTPPPPTKYTPHKPPNKKKHNKKPRALKQRRSRAKAAVCSTSDLLSRHYVFNLKVTGVTVCGCGWTPLPAELNPGRQRTPAKEPCSSLRVFTRETVPSPVSPQILADILQAIKTCLMLTFKPPR